MTSRRGFVRVHVVLGGLVILALGVGAFLYFGSDVFRTRIRSGYDQFAKWTPENIAKEPVLYLDFCETQTKDAIGKLKASEIAISQKRAKIESMCDDTRNKVTVGNKAMDELKAAYRKADAANAFPVDWQTRKLDKDQCKRQIMKLAGEIRSKTDLSAKLDGAVRQLDAQKTKVDDAREKAKEQLTKIDTNREMLKVQQITDDLKNNLVAMKGVIETSVVGVASAETGALSLDDLAKASETTVDDSEFDKIMSK